MKTETESKPEMICGCEVHPAAQLFPIMPEAELKELAEDIKKHGQIQPIVMFKGKLLDGRNRVRACEIAKVDPQFVEYIGNAPELYVASANIHRRQLKPGQRAALAVQIEKMLAAKAKERQRRGKAKVPEGEKGQAREQAAKAVGVSARYVQNAKKLERHSPKTFDEVAAGKKTLPQAMKEISGGSRLRMLCCATADTKAKSRKKQPGVGLSCADMAIEQLKSIPVKDGQREQALDSTLKWILENQGKPAKPGYKRLLRVWFATSGPDRAKFADNIHPELYRSEMRKAPAE